MAGRWNLLDQSGLSVLLECERLGIECHNAGVFASGLLAGGSTLNYKEAPTEAVEKARRWELLAAEHNFSLAEASVAFALLPTVVTKIAIGVKSPREVREAVAMLQKVVTSEAQTRALFVDAEKRALLPRGIMTQCLSSLCI
jgi:D-threo-aldose 1-dehydrogenase